MIEWQRTMTKRAWWQKALLTVETVVAYIQYNTLQRNVQHLLPCCGFIRCIIYFFENNGNVVVRW